MDDDDQWSPALRRGLEQQQAKKKKKPLLDRDGLVFVLDPPQQETECFDWVGLVYGDGKLARHPLTWFHVGDRVTKLAPPYGPHRVLLNHSFRLVAQLVSLQAEVRQIVLQAEEQIEQFAHLCVAVSDVYFNDWVEVGDDEQ